MLHLFTGYRYVGATLLIAQAIDVARNDPFIEYNIGVGDHYQMLPQVRTKSTGILLLFFIYLSTYFFFFFYTGKYWRWFFLSN